MLPFVYIHRHPVHKLRYFQRQDIINDLMKRGNAGFMVFFTDAFPNFSSVDMFVAEHVKLRRFALAQILDHPVQLFFGQIRLRVPLLHMLFRQIDTLLFCYKVANVVKDIRRKTSESCSSSTRSARKKCMSLDIFRISMKYKIMGRGVEAFEEKFLALIHKAIVY